MLKKIKMFEVDTPNGKRFLKFRPASVDSDKSIICVSSCPYGKICGKLKDPRKPNDPNSHFSDLCNGLTTDTVKQEDSNKEEGKYILSLHPAEGSLEEAFFDDEDIFKQLIEKNPVVRINDVIDKTCSNWCDSYTPEKTNCNSRNKTCIMQDLFLGCVPLAKIDTKEVYDSLVKMAEEHAKELEEKEAAKKEKEKGN